jgi:hypothetical protein
MTHLEFMPFHNKHIRFRLYNGTGKQGVVLDTIPYNKKDFATQYVFIPSDKLNEWKQADRERKNAIKEALEEKIDILNIISAELI